jgi:hypothetical protein
VIDYEASANAVFDLLDSRAWIPRRVETITVLDDIRIRREVVLLVDSQAIAAKATGPARLPLPVSFMEKNPFRDIDSRDAAGRTVATLTRTMNSLMSAHAIARGAIRQEMVPRSAYPDLVRELGNIAKSAPKAGSGTDLLNQLDIGHESTIADLIRLLEHHFVLYIWPNADVPDRTYSYSYEQELQWRPVEDRKRNTWNRARSVFKRHVTSPPCLSFPVAGSGPGLSHHLIFEPPQGTLVDAAVLLGEECGEVMALDATGSTARAHLYQDGPAGEKLLGLFWIRTLRRRTVRYAAMYAFAALALFLTSAALLFGENPLTANGTAREANEQRAAEREAAEREADEREAPEAGADGEEEEEESGGARLEGSGGQVILAVSALISIFAAAPREHELVSVLIRHIRGYVLFCGSTLIGWALLLATRPQDIPSQRVREGVLVLLAFGLPVVFGFWRSDPRRHRRPGSAAPFVEPAPLPLQSLRRSRSPDAAAPDQEAGPPPSLPPRLERRLRSPRWSADRQRDGETRLDAIERIWTVWGARAAASERGVRE